MQSSRQKRFGSASHPIKNRDYNFKDWKGVKDLMVGEACACCDNYRDARLAKNREIKGFKDLKKFFKKTG